jgi:heat shock protein HslJ
MQTRGDGGRTTPPAILALVLGTAMAMTMDAWAATGLEDSAWRLLEYRRGDTMQEAVGGERGAELRFSAGRLSGSAGCNRLMGAYMVDGDRLEMKPNMATTMMACPPPLMDQEQAVIDALGKAAKFRVDDNRLSIQDADGEPLLKLTARPDRPLTGTTWRLTSYNNGKQAVVSVLPDSEFVLQLREDGQLAGRACNNYRGGYERDDGSLRLVGPIAATRMACPEPDGIMSQEAAYFAALERLASYQIDGDQLTLQDADGATLARFEAAAQAD